MLSSSAYSFRQKSRLSISLSWVAGYTNVIALVACQQLVSHMTGNTTQFARHVADWDLRAAGFVGAVILSFLAGAAISGVMTELARRRGAQSKYMLPLAVEAILLVAVAVCIKVSGVSEQHPVAEHTALSLWVSLLGALAMGLQNATITRISGDVVRTTHLTGVLTDLGLEGVQFLLWAYDRTRGRTRGQPRVGRIIRVSRRQPSALRLALLASIFGSFMVGATAGVIVFRHFPAWALLAPVSFLAFIIFIDWHKPIADVRELDLTADPDWAGYASIKPILPPEMGIFRFTHRRRDRQHAPPDMRAWAERLPRHWRVIILAVSPQTAFDPDAVLDLSAAVQRLRTEHRDLIVCGLLPSQFRIWHKGGLTHLLGMENICADFDFAIARALNRVQELNGEGQRLGTRSPQHS